ncbi:MAG: helix-turn-helix transcriptional regulator [Ruminococcus sp.]|nr:helix-turn-helix transcriptional regulator [Ruminococcus sp.]
MNSLFEKQDSLNAPIEAYIFETDKNTFPVRPHWHYFAEFILILEGSAEAICDNKAYIVNENELMIFPPNSVHSIFSASGGLKKFAGIKFDTAKFPDTSPYAPTVQSLFSYARSKNMPFHFDSEDTGSFQSRQIFFNCIDEMKSCLYGRDVILRSQIYRLIFGIVRYWLAAGLDISECPIKAADSYGIENIAEYIDSSLEDNIRVSDIAEKCHMSYSGFAVKFRDMYGMSCKDYIERMRLYKAEEYLLFTDHDLSYISSKTGFSDCSHFIRIFKRYHGITPKQFRLQRSQPQ